MPRNRRAACRSRKPRGAALRCRRGRTDLQLRCTRAGSRQQHAGPWNRCHWRIWNDLCEGQPGGGGWLGSARERGRRAWGRRAAWLAKDSPCPRKAGRVGRQRRRRPDGLHGHAARHKARQTCTDTHQCSQRREATSRPPEACPALVHRSGVGKGVGCMLSLLMKHSMPCTMPSATRSVWVVSSSRSRLRNPVSIIPVIVSGSISENA